MGGGILSTIINPVGSLAKSIGGVGGILLDPVGSFARSQPQGSTLRMLADPVNAIAESYEPVKPPPPMEPFPEYKPYESKKKKVIQSISTQKEDEMSPFTTNNNGVL